MIAMMNPSRRTFLAAASSAALVDALTLQAAPRKMQRVFVGTNTSEGIRAFDFDSVSGGLIDRGVASSFSIIDWLALAPDGTTIYAASEVSSFLGKPTGGVIRFRLNNGALETVAQANSAGMGTCHVAVDATGNVLLSADYGGGSAASFLLAGGGLKQVSTRRYTEHGPNAARQEAAHAHFASFSPDNRFAFVNDLGGDRIHIYALNAATAELTDAGEYKTKPGAGPRTLRFHPNGTTAYCMNELDSTVDVLAWSKADGGLTLTARFAMLPEGYKGDTRACDSVITRDGRFVYFANRDNDFLYSFHADPVSGALTPMTRTSPGGKIPRNFVLDPSERWMLVANQNSNALTVLARNPATGELANEGKSFPCPAPMRILFV